MHTVKGHEESDLSVLHPLSDTVPRTLLDTGDKSRIVNDAIEYLPALKRVEACQGRGRVCVLRHGARARVAHAARLAQAVRSDCKDGLVVVAVWDSGRAHMDCMAGNTWWDMHGFGRFHRPDAIFCLIHSSRRSRRGRSR